MTLYDELPLMKFSDKTERSVNVVSVDSNHTFWILFVHDSINVSINVVLFKKKKKNVYNKIKRF